MLGYNNKEDKIPALGEGQIRMRHASLWSSLVALAISYLITSNVPWLMDLTFPGSYAILFFTASDLTSITSHIHNWELFLLWLSLVILSGAIFLLISSSILGTYRPGDFIFQCPIFLSFHTVHGILKARILKWFAIPFSSRLHLVRTLHHDPSVLGCPTWQGSSFHWVRQGCGPCDQFG